MKPLYESILRPDDDIMQAVEFEHVLKKYGWFYKSARWEGKTLRVIFDGRGYMDDLDKVAEELRCKSFSVYPWAIIKTSGTIDGLTINAETRIDINAPKVTGCKLSCKMFVTINQPSGNTKPTYTHNEFDTHMIKINNSNGITFSGNDFNKVESIALDAVGPKIEKIVMSWNFITNELNGGMWSTYPRPKGEPNMDLNPLKALGLDKHFKNVNYLEMRGGKRGSYPSYLTFVTPDNDYYDSYKSHRVGDQSIDLNSGWRLAIRK